MGFLFSFHSNRFSHVISNFLILCLLNLWNMYPVSLHWTNNVTCAFINHIIIYTRAHNVIEKLYSFPSAQPASEQSLKNRNGKIESKNYVQQVNIQTMEVQGKVSASALQQQHNAWIKLSISNRQSLECKLYFDFSKRNWFSFFSIEWSPSYSRSPSNPAILPAACYFKISGFLSIELTTTERTNTSAKWAVWNWCVRAKSKSQSRLIDWSMI